MNKYKFNPLKVTGYFIAYSIGYILIVYLLEKDAIPYMLHNPKGIILNIFTFSAILALSFYRGRESR